MEGRRPEVVERLPSGYHALYDRVLEVFGADDRVRAVWLAGSLARGDADAASDLDVMVTVRDDDLDAFASEWREWLAAITDTVLAQRLPFGVIVAAVTPGAERLDVVVDKVGDLETTMFPLRLPVLDRDGLAARLPAPRWPGPSADAVLRMVQEFFRVTAMPEVLVVREDWLLAAEHVHLLRSLLFQLYEAANAPQAPRGVKQWSARLTPVQQETLHALPTSVSSVDQLRTAHVAYARTFLATARPLAARLGIDWPTALEAAATAQVRTILGLDDPYPQ